MRILVIEPEHKPYEHEIDGSLKSMQEVVGGLIQSLYPFEESVALVANDEGKLLGLPMNRGLRDECGQLYDILCGTFFLCGIGENSFSSLTDEQVQHFKEIFAVPEMFLKFNGNLLVLPME